MARGASRVRSSWWAAPVAMVATRSTGDPSMSADRTSGDPRLLKSPHNGRIAKTGCPDRMQQDRLNDRANGLRAAAADFLYLQLSATDAFRRMQGDLLASLGFGPVESGYRVVASGLYWRLRDYGSTRPSRSVLIVAAPISGLTSGTSRQPSAQFVIASERVYASISWNGCQRRVKP